MREPLGTTIADAPPGGEEVTAYDRRHLRLYARLLDAERAGAPLGDVTSRLFGIDAGAEPDRAKAVHASHLARARWMAERGYRDLLHNSKA
jgi:Uncharacterized conserved protein (DUF2285)